MEIEFKSDLYYLAKLLPNRVHLETHFKKIARVTGRQGIERLNCGLIHGRRKKSRLKWSVTK